MYIWFKSVIYLYKTYWTIIPTWLTSQLLKCSLFDTKIRRRNPLAETSTLLKDISVQVKNWSYLWWFLFTMTFTQKAVTLIYNLEWKKTSKILSFWVTSWGWVKKLRLKSTPTYHLAQYLNKCNETIIIIQIK